MEPYIRSCTTISNLKRDRYKNMRSVAAQVKISENFPSRRKTSWQKYSWCHKMCNIKMNNGKPQGEEMWCLENKFIRPNGINFDVLLTVHLSIILVTDQHNVQILVL